MKIKLPESLQLQIEIKKNTPYLVFSTRWGQIHRNLKMFKGFAVKVQNDHLHIECLESPILATRSSHLKSLFLQRRQLFRSILKDCLSALKPYQVTLETRGLGYRWHLEKSQDKTQTLCIHIGKSHKVMHTFPPSVYCVVQHRTQIKLYGITEEALSNEVASLTAIRKKDPYKGKGIFVLGFKPNLKESSKKN